MKMSRSRIAASLAGVFSAAGLAATAAVWFFPISSPAQTAVDDPGISVDAGGTLLHRNPVHYPPGAPAAGTVTVEATLDTKGEVSDAHVTSGPEELRNAALSSVLGWHYSNNAGALSRVQISIRFDQPQAPAAAPIQPPPPPALSGPNRIKSIQFWGISPEAEQDLRNRLQIHEGDTVTPADIQRIRQEVQEYDSHLSARFTMQAASNGETGLRMAVAASVNGSGPISVGGQVQSSKLVNKTAPVYPPGAKQAGIQGTVELGVLIGADGTVKEVQLDSGDPLLAPAAIDAVKQWVYSPTRLNGNPVEVLTEVAVNFTLSQ
jgi:TonB family protein